MPDANDALIHVACDLCGGNHAEVAAQKDGMSYARCLDCGFVYSNPRRSVPATDNEQYFAKTMEGYIASAYSPGKQRQYARVLQSLERFRKTGRLLEIGSSVGGFLYRAREMGWNPVGVEPVQACAAFAREQHGLDSRGCLLEEAALPEKHFDVVYSNAVFEHLESPTAVMRQAVAHLRPGGVIYTKTVNIDSYTHEFCGSEWKLIAPVGHLSMFTPNTLRRLCEMSGLEAIEVRTNGFRPAVTRQPGLPAMLRKAFYSALARWRDKGDRVIVIARRPSR